MTPDTKALIAELRAIENELRWNPDAQPHDADLFRRAADALERAEKEKKKAWQDGYDWRAEGDRA